MNASANVLDDLNLLELENPSVLAEPILNAAVSLCFTEPLYLHCDGPHSCGRISCSACVPLNYASTVFKFKLNNLAVKGLKIKCDINQQYLKTVDLYLVKSE